VFILKFMLYMFRTDTPFLFRSLRITVCAALCAYYANSDQLQQQHNDSTINSHYNINNINLKK
jgi:hypothetical protein